MKDLLCCNALRPMTNNSIQHNGLVKKYPDGSAKILASDRAIFRERGWEARERRGDERSETDAPQAAPDDPARERDNLERSKRRARSAVYDLARSNDFEFFVTLTTSPEKVDRFNDDEVFRKLYNWLDNAVRRRGLAYVLIPEYHKAGGLHFHAFMRGDLEAVDSGTLSVTGRKRPLRPRSAAERQRLLDAGAHIVYNLPEWGLGFSTAIRLYGDPRQAVGYVCKYITKSERKIGGRWYYSGGDLRRPEVACCDLDFESAFAVAGSGFEIGSLGAICCQLEG